MNHNEEPLSFLIISILPYFSKAAYVTQNTGPANANNTQSHATPGTKSCMLHRRRDEVMSRDTPEK
jgi:hypothetical protein